MQQTNSLKIIKQLGFTVTNYIEDQESKAYLACQYNLNGLKIIGRTAKMTPKKIGQFVTFWKRSDKGPIMPFEESDQFDFLIITVRSADYLGQFIFPQSVLIKKGIVTNITKEGKRAFRVYPPWDKPVSKQAIASQKWQVKYFYEINDKTNKNDVEQLLKQRD
ncbi:MAG: MepB family protein [Crocinitomicaceae bacterium]